MILPILYVETPNFSEENSDEAVALIARTQYVDWRSVRFLEPNSRREYRAAVNVLARRLVEIARQVTEKQIKQEFAANPEDDGIDGVADLIRTITDSGQSGGHLVTGAKFYLPQSLAVLNEYHSRKAKAN